MLIFRNPGLIDLAAITTLGVSVKEGDSPIGYFGTGLKFAIATLLREGCSIDVWRGMDRYEFGTRSETVRGETFQLVTMTSHGPHGMKTTDLGFTDQLGRDWEPWMAYRELASNCRDEGGEAYKWTPGMASAERPEWTTIKVTGQAILDVWPERGTILLESQPVVTTDTADLHPGPSSYAYFRGVRVYELARPSAFTYNVKSRIELTEDRTAKWWFEIHYAVAQALAKLTDPKLVRQVLTVGDSGMEHHLDVDTWEPTPEYRAAARELVMGRETVQGVNPKAVAAARKSALADMEPGQDVQLDAVQQAMLDKARRMLTAGGFQVDDFPIVVADTLGPNICGLAQDGRIYLSLLPFRKGTREVAATLLEEFAHLASGCGDETRDFQNWLLDQLLVQAERTAGEPF